MNRSNSGRVAPRQKQLRAARGALLASVVGIVIAVATGFTLVPRVRPVEVLIVLGTAFGAGASFVVAVREFRDAGRRR